MTFLYNMEKATLKPCTPTSTIYTGSQSWLQLYNYGTYDYYSDLPLKEEGTVF